MVFNNWRDFIDKLPYDCGSTIRKFVLWEQRNEQRGKNNYLNTAEFPYSVVKCEACNKYLGNKTIKNHKLNYRIVMIKDDLDNWIKNPLKDTEYAYYCLECGDIWDNDKEISQFRDSVLFYIE